MTEKTKAANSESRYFGLPKNACFSTIEAAVSTFGNVLNRQLADQLQMLLENKHLYQRTSIDPVSMWKELEAHNYSHNQQPVQDAITTMVNTRLRLTSNPTDLSAGKAQYPTLLLKNVNLFCSKCGKQAHAPIYFENATNKIVATHGNTRAFSYDTSSSQILFLTYECQLCHGLPNSFIVRLSDWSLILEGCSPMEHIELPRYIPNKERHLYRDAVIAFNTGKRLAAVFYLRSFIEQFARRVTGITGKCTGDEIMDTYASTLPSDLRGKFPSFREWYDKLSEPIHNADEEAAGALWDDAKLSIDHHFEIRGVFRVPETQVRPESKGVDK
jgi:hypothetical protein